MSMVFSKHRFIVIYDMMLLNHCGVYVCVRGEGGIERLSGKYSYPLWYSLQKENTKVVHICFIYHSINYSMRPIVADTSMTQVTVATHSQCLISTRKMIPNGNTITPPPPKTPQNNVMAFCLYFSERSYD